MKYHIYYKVKGLPNIYRLTAENATIRESIMNYLETKYTLTMISYSKISKDGSEIPVKTVYIGLK